MKQGGTTIKRLLQKSKPTAPLLLRGVQRQIAGAVKKREEEEDPATNHNVIKCKLCPTEREVLYVGETATHFTFFSIFGAFGAFKG